MGVDVGLTLHLVIRTRPDAKGGTRLLLMDAPASFDVLDELMEMYRVRICVVDAQPEGRKAREFARKWGKRARLAYYDRHEGDHAWAKDGDGGVRTVHVNRTQALDEMFDRFKQGKAKLPANARELGDRVRDGMGEYYRQMTALKRVLEQDAQGNWVARYPKQNKPDHYAHAEVYCLLASKTRDLRGGVGRIITF